MGAAGLAPLLLGATLTVSPAIAVADAGADAARIAELATHLGKQADDKERLGAVIALTRLDDPRTLKPLLLALGDDNAHVRLLAATALGRLEQLGALGALRDRAANDSDAKVRARAQAAVDKLVVASQAAAAAQSGGPGAGRTAGFGRDPRAVAKRPELYVVIKSWRDDSPGKTDKAARKLHAQILHDTMLSELKGAAVVTCVQADAERFRLDPRQLDLSVVKMEVHPAGQMMEVEAQLRLAVSDGNGLMMSFISGGAKVQVPRSTYNKASLPALRRQAVEGAVQGLFAKLIEHLRRTRS